MLQFLGKVVQIVQTSKSHCVAEETASSLSVGLRKTYASK